MVNGLTWTHGLVWTAYYSLILLHSKARTPNKSSLKLAVMLNRFLDKLTCLYQKQRKRRPLNYSSDVIILEISFLTYSHQMIFFLCFSLFFAWWQQRWLVKCMLFLILVEVAFSRKIVIHFSSFDFPSCCVFYMFN